MGKKAHKKSQKLARVVYSKNLNLFVRLKKCTIHCLSRCYKTTKSIVIIMFRLRRAHVHDHDSDAEQQQQDCCNNDNHHAVNTGGGGGGGEVMVAPTPTSTTSSGSTAAVVRRKRVRRTVNGGVNSSKQRSSSFLKQWIKLRRPETSAIFVLGITGCIIAGCLLFVVLKIFSAITSGNHSNNQYNKHGQHHGKNFQGWGGGVYKGPPLLHGGPVPNIGSGKRRGLLQQHQHEQHHPHGHTDDDGNGNGDDSYEPLPWNPIYRIPEAHENVGDRSDAYAKLRKEIDPILPIDAKRSLQRLQELQRRNSITGKLLGSQSYEINAADNEEGTAEPYDIYNCPDQPPRNYPFEWKLVDEVLHTWPADEIEIPNRIHQGLCVFDYIKDYKKAMRYRMDELPFIVTGDPDVARTVERWSIPGYMEELMGYSVRHRAEYNTNNHFLYHQPPPPKMRRGMQPRGRGRRVLPARGGGDPSRDEPEGLQDLYGRPAKLQRSNTMPDEIRMTYTEWLSKANVTGPVGPNDEHWYFRLIGCGYMGADGSCDAGSSEYLFDELPFFQPINNLYLGQGDQQKGIHCRFGMKGVIAENHFDASRNSIVVLRGSRRYILSHPNNCDRLTLLPQGHPSARHSAVDYTNPDLETFPEFAEATANEVVLQAGQVLYLPTNWFHFIVSLDLNMQCNTRSGMTKHYQEPIEQCGF